MVVEVEHERRTATKLMSRGRLMIHRKRTMCYLYTSTPAPLLAPRSQLLVVDKHPLLASLMLCRDDFADTVR